MILELPPYRRPSVRNLVIGVVGRARLFVRRAGTVVSKRELLTEVWHLPYGGSDKTVDVHLSWLRRKLGESAAEPRLLQTVRGVGVRLAEPEP